jgi:hypothetical protein
MYIWDILLNSNSNFPCEHYIIFLLNLFTSKLSKHYFFLMKTFFYASNKLLLTKKKKTILITKYIYKKRINKMKEF